MHNNRTKIKQPPFMNKVYEITSFEALNITWDSFISRSLRSCEGNCKENVTLIKRELLVRSSVLRIIPCWSCVKNRRSVLSRVYLNGKVYDIFSLFSSRICSFLPLLFLSREISCKQLVSSLQVNKNGGHDLVQCSLICHFLPSKIADELLSFCLLISDLFVLFVFFYFSSISF